MPDIGPKGGGGGVIGALGIDWPIKMSTIPRGQRWYTNMSGVSLFGNTSMAAATALENPL